MKGALSRKKRGAPSLAVDKHELPLGDELTLDPDERSRAGSKRPSKMRKRQEGGDFVEEKTTQRILQEARKQQEEMDQERDEETGVAATRRAFGAVESSRLDSDSDEEEDHREGLFSDLESQYEEAVEVTDEDERALAAFMSAGAAPQRTLADIIMEKIQEKGQERGLAVDQTEEEEAGPRIPGLDPKVVEVYTGVGKLLSRYRSGKVPKALKIVPNLANWEEILYLTEPEKWSPGAVYQATRLFASNLNAKMAQRFYSLVLLPRLRDDIAEHKKLHFALYQALKKAVYKPAAFYKGVLLPLCASGTCTLREAVIVGSVLQKVSIPVLHSSVALLKIAQMPYSGTNSYFLRLLLDKKYALPYRVLDALVAHFVNFLGDDRQLPVVWHQALLCFVQRYKDDLDEGDKQQLKRLMQKHSHYQVTPEIHRELANSSSRGQKLPGGAHRAPVSQVLASKEVKMQEDFRDLPEVHVMDEDY